MIYDSQKARYIIASNDVENISKLGKAIGSNEGEFWGGLLGGSLGAISGGTFNYLMNKGNTNFFSCGLAILSGGAIGFLTGSYFGEISGSYYGEIKGRNLAHMGIEENEIIKSCKIEGMIKGGFTGGFTGSVAGLVMGSITYKGNSHFINPKKSTSDIYARNDNKGVNVIKENFTLSPNEIKLNNFIDTLYRYQNIFPNEITRVLNFYKLTDEISSNIFSNNNSKKGINEDFFKVDIIGNNIEDLGINEG